MAKDPAFLLFQVGGLPGAVEMVQGDEPVLHICAGAELGRGPHQDPYLAGADFGKQFLLSGLCVGLMDKGDFLLRDALCDELFADVIVDVEGSVALGCGEVTEAELGGPILFRVLPDPEHVLDTAVDLALRIIRQHGIDQALIQSALSPVVGDLEHVVLCGLDLSGTDGLRTVSKGRDKLFLLLTGL